MTITPAQEIEALKIGFQQAQGIMDGVPEYTNALDEALKNAEVVEAVNRQMDSIMDGVPNTVAIPEMEM